MWLVLACVAGLRLRLWCGHLGQWLWVRADHPWCAEWKHPGGLRGVLPPAWQGEYRLHSRTHSHAGNGLCFLKATWHFHLTLCIRKMNKRFIYCWLASATVTLSLHPRPPLREWPCCSDGVTNIGMMNADFFCFFIFRLLHLTATQCASLNLLRPTQTSATR